jgi:putative ABC transport system substrate-binding protein
MHRRSFLTLLGGAAAASGWPLAARAQQATMPVIGILSGDVAGSYADPAFRQGLSIAGYVEGRNIALEYHWANFQYDRLPALAADFVRRQVNVIWAIGIQSVMAAKAATSTIPVVFSVGVNPVELGLVASLNRPGGNLTGVTSLDGELIGKRLQLLHEALPPATVIAGVVNPTESNSGNLARNLETVARAVGRQVLILHASTERDLDQVFATLREGRAGALVIGGDAFLASQSDRFATTLLRDRVPAIYGRREFVIAGGLMSYVPNRAEYFRTAGVYIGRIVKGEKPAELPVQQASKIDLIINLKTAAALGIEFPTSLLVRADEVIE